MFTTMDTIQTVEGAASHPDAGLVTLGEQLRAAWSRERLVVATAPETDDGEAAVDAAVNETGAIADKIAGLQAMAFEGLGLGLGPRRRLVRPRRCWRHNRKATRPRRRP